MHPWRISTVIKTSPESIDSNYLAFKIVLHVLNDSDDFIWNIVVL